MTTTPGRDDRPRDEHWMALAIEAARRAPALPFGAVLVDEAADALRATGWNRGGNDPTGHGEIDVIQRLAAAASDVDCDAVHDRRAVSVVRGRGGVGWHPARRVRRCDPLAGRGRLVADRSAGR